jgi:hypothetical protein
VSAVETKAVGFNSAVRGIKAIAGDEAFGQLVKMLPAETVALIEKPPLAVAWISPIHFEHLATHANKLCFEGREEPLLQAAKRAMKDDLSTLYKVFIRLLSPQYVIERGTKIWDTYNRNNGALVARQTGDRSAEVRYTGIVTSYPEFWVWQRGCIIGALEQTGLKMPGALLKSGGGHGPEAIIECNWS